MASYDPGVRVRIAVLIATYAAIAAVVYVFVGYQVAPCLGGPGIDNSACVEAWLAERPWNLWLVSTPYPEIAGFLLATGLTIWLARRGRV